MHVPCILSEENTENTTMYKRHEWELKRNSNTHMVRMTRDTKTRGKWRFGKTLGAFGVVNVRLQLFDSFEKNIRDVSKLCTFPLLCLPPGDRIFLRHSVPALLEQ